MGLTGIFPGARAAEQATLGQPPRTGKVLAVVGGLA
jgi:hypothetical protein